MVYKWKAGSRFNADAQLVGSEVAALGREVTAATALHAAENKETELHKCFEWNNKKAAHAYRLVQARALLRSIVFVQEVANADPVEVRAYECVSVHDNGGPSRVVYMTTTEALSDEDMRAQVFQRLSNTISEAAETTRKYQEIIGPKAKPVARHLDRAARALEGAGTR